MAVADDILASLKRIEAHLAQLLASVPKPPPAIADDADLDGQYGNPVIRAAVPRDWTGPSQLGKPFSECPPAYLDMLASRLEYFAQKAEAEGKLTAGGKPVSPFNRRDAARARGWAKRLRDGWKPAPADLADEVAFPSDGAPVDAMLDESSIPF